MFVPFEKNFPEQRQNPNLANELSKELPGIFNWAYDGMLRLQKAGRFFRPQKCITYVEEYRKDTNPARSFLLDNYSYGLEFDGLPCKEVYDYYVSWCHDNGYRPLNSANFSKEVKRTMPNVSIVKYRNNGKQQRKYQGLSIQEGSEITR